MTSDDVLREWDHHAQDLGWLAWGLINSGDSERAYAAAYCAAHYAHCILRWEEMKAGKPACPQCASVLDSPVRDAITCSDYEAETQLGQQLMDGTDYPGDCADLTPAEDLAEVGD